MTKKAQAPTILIFLVALALVGIALYAMATFSEMMNEAEFNQFYIEAEAKLIAKQTLAKCQSCSSEQLKEEYREIAEQTETLVRPEGIGNFYSRISSGDFQIENNILKVENPFVESIKSNNKITRNFNLEINFQTFIN